MPKTLYVAGPMSNLPQFNFPLFEAVSVALREDGYTIVSPHECDSEETRVAAWASPDGKYTDTVGNETWGDCLARDVKMLADGVRSNVRDEDNAAGETVEVVEYLKIDGIAFLPNWEKSRGARLEAFVGLLTGKSFYVVNHFPEAEDMRGEFTLTEVTPHWVQHMLALDWAAAIRMHAPL